MFGARLLPKEIPVLCFTTRCPARSCVQTSWAHGGVGGCRVTGAAALLASAGAGVRTDGELSPPQGTSTGL